MNFAEKEGYNSLHMNGPNYQCPHLKYAYVPNAKVGQIVNIEEGEEGSLREVSVISKDGENSGWVCDKKLGGCQNCGEGAPKRLA